MTPLRPLWLLLLVAPAWARDAGPADGGPDAEVDAGQRLREASTLVDTVFRQMAREENERCIRMAEKKRYPEAIAACRRAHEAAPDDPEITNNYAYLQSLLGNVREARRLYRATLKLDPDRGVAHLNLADLLMRPGARPGELEEARRLLERAREILGNDARVVLQQARLAVRQGRMADAERLYARRLDLKVGDDALYLELGDFHRDRGQSEEALRWYRRVRDPGGAVQQAAQRIREIEIERRARAYGWQPPDRAVPEQAVRLRAQARAALRQGDVEEAARMLGEALAQAPLFAAAHADLGDVSRERGESDAAELAYLRALALDSGNAEVLVRLATLHGDEARWAEAAWALQRALQIRPDWTHLELRLARVYQGAGDIPRALAWVERYVADLPEDRPDEQALALKRVLERHPDARRAPLEPVTEPDGRNEALARALALFERGEADAALAELDQIPPEKRGTAVLNLRGSLMHRAGRLEEAGRAFTASLGRDPKQPAVKELLADVRLREGRTAEGRALLLEAEAAGAGEARLALARLDLEPDEGWLADLGQIDTLRASEARLERYLHGEPARRGEAERLLERAGERLEGVYLAAGVFLAAVLLALLLTSGRLWGGVDLGALVGRHPESGPEVQRVLSAIRHEVLKHNTMVLTGLADALEQGDDVGEKAAWCRESLLGAPGAHAPDCAAARLAGYAEQLRQVARAHGERLNLERRDPAVGVLLRGFRALYRAAPLLDRAGSLGAGGRGRLLKALRRAARLLNVEGYEAVRALLDRLRMLEVDEPLLRAVYDRTRREPAFAEVEIAPLELDLRLALPVRVAVPRHAFEDLLGNLLRNAVQSTLRHGGAPVYLGLGVEAEVDGITGLERLVLLIRDRSPQRLTPEMLRGRYIEEGLGLTADLVSRYEGTLDVREGSAPWVKAVVVKLPLLDEEEVEDA